ncbi:DUF4097 family beta strand repeat-containing protein [Streptomyces resistomycificus]|uniref:DUF4097 family beta strand repeat-containing protein n=1 Tax=Streptomyces resistomycificus TaxID=67356 RepID=UPI0006902890|nr:DUF4097 family beta strand repeat-containing protein [Streptomyces resistomycificus]KUN90533.1 hypothetical protein AQJ84_39460 [Streptomyces resistomycificus]
MPVFDTPEPILVTIELGVGTVHVVASDRTDTTVHVRPGDRADFGDVVTAAEAVVDYADGELLVSVGRPQGLPRGGGSVIVDIEVPTGSGVQGDALAADFSCEGRVGECHITTACGHLRFARTGSLYLSSLLGNVTAQHVSGDVEAVTECGDVTLHTVEGTVRLTRTLGATHLGEVAGATHVSAHSGQVRIGRAHAAVEARTVQGDIRIDEALRGPLALESEAGGLDVAIADGAGARLDLDSASGTVYRSLDLLDTLAAVPPAAATRMVEVRARTRTGDIVLRRAALAPDDGSQASQRFQHPWGS